MSGYEWGAVLETLGVALLAVLGVLLGRWFSKLDGRKWLVGYVVPFALMAVVAVGRWLPKMELVAPFSWLHADRMEFAVMAVVTTVMLTTTLVRLQPRQRVYVSGFMAAFTVYFSLLPFAYPAITHDRLAALETNLDANGVCLQSTNFNCGPAAAVTVLRKRGIDAHEGELALDAHTNPFAGTPTDALCRSIGETYSVPCHIEYFESVDEIADRVPWVAVVKYSFMIDHYVAVLAVEEDSVLLGDPLSGEVRLPKNEFEKQWRKYAVLVGD